jgi:peptidoglycan/LPS O-acetylase OafA/YrhL
MTSNKASTIIHPKYRFDIDGLRAIAVLSVIGFHAFPEWIHGGFIGVDIFFVISGYLISTIIFENLDRNTFNFFDFYARRIKRIFPALIFVLIICLAFGWLALLADELVQLGKHIAAGAGFISNFVYWDEAGYFDKSAETKPLLHLWSLSIEEQFYVLWPLLLWLSWKFRFNLLIITIFAAIVTFILNVKGIKHDMVATFYSPQSRFWELLSGSVLAWITLYAKDFYSNIKTKTSTWLSFAVYWDKQTIKYTYVANALSFAGLLLLVFGFCYINKQLSFPGLWALIPVLGAILIIAAGSKTWINQTILSNRVLVWFGLISFPLYLWHWPLLSFLRIIYGEVPSIDLRLIAIALSVALAWLTYSLIEYPIRFGRHGKAKVTILCVLVFMVGVFGLIVSRTDFTHSHSYEKLAIKRKGFEHAFGYSLAWYRGKDDWLFLGNDNDYTVAKLKLAIVPSDIEIKATTKIFTEVAATAAKFNTKVVLFVGPNKSSIYPEYLPDELLPSSKKYSSFFLDELKDIPNLTIYNPTDDFLRLKKTEGIIYWMTNTHWNDRGAFLAYSGFSKIFNLPVPVVEFKQGSTSSGDLLELSKLKDFPLHAEDNWDVIWKNKPTWTEIEMKDEQKTAFGSSTLVINKNPLSNKYIWVVGDSFAGGLRPYLNATFKEIRYVGHWKDKLKDVPEELARADRKPDMLIIVKVERSF